MLKTLPNEAIEKKLNADSSEPTHPSASSDQNEKSVIRFSFNFILNDM